MAARPGSLISVNLAKVRDDPSAKYADLEVKPKTGIDKRPAGDAVMIELLGADGDTICDVNDHGGLDQALYAYATEDAAWWAAELGDELAFEMHPGAFGENLTLQGIDVTGALIGERWQIGEVVVQVTKPRIPCSTFAGFWGVPQLVKRFTEAGRPGAYLRVIEAGRLAAGDPVRIVHQPDHDLTLGEMFRALTGDRSLAPKLLTASDVPEEARDKARTWLR